MNIDRLCKYMSAFIYIDKRFQCHYLMYLKMVMKRSMGRWVINLKKHCGF